MATENGNFKKIISHAKEYGFVFPSSEISELRNEIISLKIRGENFLKKERLMLLENLYNLLK